MPENKLPARFPRTPIQPVLFDEPYTIQRLGKDEMNLTDHSFWIVDDRRDKRDEIEYREGEFYWIARGKAHGLPNMADLDHYVVMMELTREQDWPAQVQFSQYDVVVKRLRKSDSGQYYERLKQFLDRMRGIEIQAQRVKLNGRWRRDVSFGIMTNYSLITYEDRHHDQNWFIWDPMLLASMRAGYIKDLDVDFFLGLENGWSKVLYRYLDRRAGGDGKPEYIEDLDQFARRLGMEVKGLSRAQILQRLENGHRELTEKGFLRDWRCPPPPKRGQPVAITYQFGPRTTYYARMFAAGKAVPALRSAPEPPTPSGHPAPLPAPKPTQPQLALEAPHAELIRQMGGYGLTVRAAQSLIRKHGAERCQRYVDWMPRYTYDDAKKFLSAAIAHEYDPPEESREQKRERAARQDVQRTRRELDRRRAEEQELAAQAVDFQRWWAAQDDEFRGRIRNQALQNVQREHAKLLRGLEERGRLQDSSVFQGLLDEEIRRLSGWKPTARAAGSA